MDEQLQPAAVEDDVRRRPSLNKGGKAGSAVILAVFALYVAFLLKLLLFSRVPGSERSVNLIPFASIAEFMSSHSSRARGVSFANVVGNILIFIPLGAYVSWIRRRAPAWLIMLMVTSVSVAAEIIQGVFAVGAADIDDVILNCAGGLIGILAFRLLSAILHRQSLVRTAMAVLSLLSLPVWCYFLFVVRLHM